MNDSGKDNKERNREIARNEEKRQTIGAVRVSVWAVALAVIIAAIVWVWLRR
jgi:cytoskeletal protein RodZ